MDPNANNYQNQYNQYNSYPTNNQYGGGFLDQIRYAKRLNGLEVITIFISICILIITFIFGFISAQQSNEDAQRIAHLQQVSLALTEYYNSSSAVPSQRSYPVATCSADANEVDFELTLRLSLTGQIKEKDTHAYIEPNDFPKDISGVYSKNLAKRSVTFRCPSAISPAAVTDKNANIYADGWESCNFNKVKSPKCYLYASSNNGDTFTLGYFSQQLNKFVLYTKFRDQNIVKSIS